MVLMSSRIWCIEIKDETVILKMSPERASKIFRIRS